MRQFILHRGVSSKLPLTGRRRAAARAMSWRSSVVVGVCSMKDKDLAQPENG